MCCAEAAGGGLFCYQGDSSGGAALGAVEVFSEGGGVARPDGVYRAALTGPGFEVFVVFLELGEEEAEFVEGFGCERRAWLVRISQGKRCGEEETQEHTYPVVLVVELAAHQLSHFLKVLLCLVECVLQRARLFELVGSPVTLVGKHE